MELKIYLIKKRIRVHEFCETLGCSRTHLSGVMNGLRKASLVLAKAIEKETNGAVTAKEVLNQKAKE